MLRFIDRDVTVRRVRSHWSLWSVSFLWPQVSSSLINPRSRSAVKASKPITAEGKVHTILCPTANPNPPVHNGWDNLTCFFNFKSAWFSHFQQPQLPITTEGKHQNSDSNCSQSRVWHPREHQWPNYPKTPNIISCLWPSLLRLCSSIGVETDLWLLNLPVIKRQRVASWGTNSWLFTCWLPCPVSGDPFSLCGRHSMIPHDKLDCSSSESCWIILVLSIASPTPEIFLYCCLWAISLDSHRCRYSICSVTPKANEMC